MFMAAVSGVSAQVPDSITAAPGVPAAAPADTSVTLSLERCLEIALSDNPSIKVADMEITRYDYSRKEVLGQLLPSVSFGVNYNRMLAKQVAYMNMDGFPSMGGGDGEEGDTPESRAGKDGDTGIKMGLDNSWSMGFNASLPLIAPPDMEIPEDKRRANLSTGCYGAKLAARACQQRQIGLLSASSGARFEENARRVISDGPFHRRHISETI